MVQIKKHRSFTELQFGIASLVLGNKAIIFLTYDFLQSILTCKQMPDFSAVPLRVSEMLEQQES